MKKLIGVFGALAIVASCCAASASAQDAKLTERLDHSAASISEIMHTPDKGIPASILAKAHCVVVIPGYKKAAFVVGGQYGQGVASCRTHHGWSGPVFVQLTGGSFGFQIGGQETDLVLLAMNDHGLEDMLRSKLKLGADASVAAGPVGRNAAADTDVTMHAEFLTYSRARGIFAGINLSGTVLSQNGDDTRAEYGSDVPYQNILHGSVPPPANSMRFVHTVARYFVVARDSQ